MKQYLNKGIKEIIADFPAVGELLDVRDIACVTCGVGTCLLKDIIEIHNLPEDQEIELMSKIEQAQYLNRRW